MTTVAATLAVLAVPATASAATYTVAPSNGACSAPADLACGSLTDAAAAATAGDVFNVAPGTYDGATFSAPGVTITGAPGVAINGTMTFSGDTPGAPSKLQKVAISQPVGNAPGINVSGTAGLQLLDAAVVSLNGDGIIITGGAANAIIRCLVITAGQVTSAVRVTSTAGSPDKGLLLESSMLTGGGAGLSANSDSLALVQAGAGDINITARHITAAGSTNGISLDSSNAASILGAPVGNIVADVIDSIALNNKTKRYAVVTPNQAVINATRTTETADPNTIFADAAGRNFRLRPGSAAIDAGGFTAGESTTDIDGDPRPGPITDRGADEFVNAPPVANIVVKTAKPRDGQPTLFDGSGSTDREAKYGGGIVEYRWTFGDGTAETTTTPTVMHTYKAEGAAAAQLVVVDRQGAVSAPAAARVDVGDGVPPAATVTKPFPNQRIALTRKTTKTVTKNGVKRKVTTRRRTKLTFGGLAKDKSGIGFVVLTLEKLSSNSSSGTKTAKASRASSKALCTWFDPKKGLLRKSCAKPVLIVAKFAKDGSWTYGVSTQVKQPSPGLYRISVYAADGSGAFGNSAPPNDSVVRFRLTK
jgi:PKD domain-containing protein